MPGVLRIPTPTVPPTVTATPKPTPRSRRRRPFDSKSGDVNTGPLAEEGDLLEFEVHRARDRSPPLLCATPPALEDLALRKAPSDRRRRTPDHRQGGWPGGLRLRRPVLDRLCHAGDPDRARGRGPGALAYGFPRARPYL